MKAVVLKVECTHFYQIANASKTFEVRDDTKGVEEGDLLVLLETDKGIPTGKSELRKAGHILNLADLKSYYPDLTLSEKIQIISLHPLIDEKAENNGWNEGDYPF